MRARYLIGTCLGALMAASLSAQGEAASLESELALMLTEHPQMKFAEKNTQSAIKGIGVAESSLFPTVSLNSDYGYEWITNPTERANSDGKNDSSMARQVVGVTVTQNLFNGFADEASIKSSKLTLSETEATEETTRQGLILQGINAYLNVLKQQRRIIFARENEANIKKQMELEDERVRRGSGIGIDVLNAKSRLQTAKDKRVEYEGQLATASDQYMQVFGHAPDLAAMIDPEPPLDLLPRTLEEAIEVAVKSNPNLQTKEFTVEKAAENKRTVRAEYMPTVDLNSSYNYERDKNGTAGTRRDWSVLVEANWDLFSGFSTDYSMKRAVFDHAASKNDLAFSVRKTIEGTRIAWHTMETAEERLALMENDVILKEEIFLSTRKQRESGAEGVDVLQVLDREKEVYETKIKFAELYYDTRLSIYGVLAAVGHLKPEVLSVE